MSNEEEFENIYNKILDGVDDWDYSTLDRLIELSEKDGLEKGEEMMKVKAIEAHWKTCPNLSKDNDRTCRHLADCDRNCLYMNEFKSNI